MRQSIGNIKKTYIKEEYLLIFIAEKFKKIINPTNKKISFLASTSISEIGYKRNIGLNIAKIVIKFFGTFFK